MNYRLIMKTMGSLLICEAGSMALPLIVSLIYGDGGTHAFLTSIALLLMVGFLLRRVKPYKRNFYTRDGFALAAFGWLFISLFGAIPFFVSGAIPSPIDCFFETCSGFSTTGATILTNVERLPHSLLFWRSFTHWLGGMGVLVLTLALMPKTDDGSFQIMKAESPGPKPSKIVPRVRETAKILYTIYLGISIIEIILLCAAGMPLFDSLIHTFGTVGTGGFSNKNLSIGAYGSPLIEIIITVFMIASGVNFALYYKFLNRDYKTMYKDEELRTYLLIILLAIAGIGINLYYTYGGALGEILRTAAFQVASIITTTGYTTADFNQWPMFSKMILLALMFVGACAGSTGGGIKNVRILVLLRAMKQELRRILHPQGIYRLRYNGKNVDDRTVSEVVVFFFIYIVIFAVAVLIVSLDNFDFMTTISSVAATLNNVGPGFNVVGATGNFSSLSDLSKLVLSLCMLTGRLELYPMLLLCMPTFWKKVNI